MVKYLKNIIEKYEIPITYAAKNKDAIIRMASRSGGFFSALSDEILLHNGVVYGCVLNEEFGAIHVRAETPAERDCMRGSKYIQSDMSDIFLAVKEDLVSGREVLFSGTSCQVAGLLGYLGSTYENLYCVDIVCHGVPSSKVWKDYLNWQETRMRSKVVGVDFRNKSDYGWRAHMEKLCFENGKIENSNVYTTLFYGHSILRPCCYKCPYKAIIHPGNITIADYWGIENVAPDFDDDRGVSLILINDNIGRKLFEEVKNKLEVYKTRIEDSMQPPLIKPFDSPKIRNKFWKDYAKLDFEKIAKKYGGFGLLQVIRRKIKSIIKRIIPNK